MVGEEGRGAVLEGCLTKLMFASPTTQVVGMSATLSNLHQLAAFLSAEVFSDDFRPVSLQAHKTVECVDDWLTVWLFSVPPFCLSSAG